MTSYLVGRLLQSILITFLTSLIVFVAINASGDPAALLAPLDAEPAEVAALRIRMGLDRPLHMRYLRFLGELVSGELRSFRHKRPPMELVAPHLYRSLQLGIPAIVIAALIAIPSGVLAAIRRGTAYDGVILAGALVGQAVPLFLLSTILIWVFAVNLKWLPVSGRGSIQHYIMPVVSLTVFNLAILVRLTRSSVLEILDEDYMRTARAKGLRERLVMLRHALPNAALPVVSLMGLRIGALVSGTLIVEAIFSWPGLGKLLYDAVLQRDIPLVVVGSLSVAVMITILNLLVDLSYAVLDPRIRYQ